MSVLHRKFQSAAQHYGVKLATAFYDPVSLGRWIAFCKPLSSFRSRFHPSETPLELLLRLPSCLFEPHSIPSPRTQARTHVLSVDRPALGKRSHPALHDQSLMQRRIRISDTLSYHIANTLLVDRENGTQ